MINLLPTLMLAGFSANTNGNGFNYKSYFELSSRVTLLCAYDNSNLQVDTIEGNILFLGQFYCNNAYNYLFEFNDFVWTMFYNQTSSNTTGGSTISYRFDDRYGHLDLFGHLDLSYDGSLGFNFDNVDYLQDLNQDYYEDNIEDSDFDGSIYTISFTIDFENDSTWVDSFENTVFSGLYELSNGTDQAFAQGYNSGYDVGYSDGHRDGRDEGYDIGFSQGESYGYNEGYEDGFSADATALTIFGGIIAVGMIPINFFLSIFNFEILGINFTAFVSSLLSVACVLIVIKHVLAIKDD